MDDEEEGYLIGHYIENLQKMKREKTLLKETAMTRAQQGSKVDVLF